MGNKENVYYQNDKNVLAHHLIQSFSPEDKLTPEEVHEIGRKTAIELTGGEYGFVIAAHLDKGHLHNHIIYNSTNEKTLKKFRWNERKTYNAYKGISDKYASLAGAIIVTPDKGRLKAYGSYHREINFKDEIRSRVVFLLKHSTSLGDFEQKAAQLNLGVDWTGEHTTYRLLEQEQKRATGARSLIKKNETPRYNVEQIYEATKINDGAVYSAEEIKAAYAQEREQELLDFQLRFTIEPWQVEAQSEQGIHVKLDYGLKKHGTVLIPASALEPNSDQLEVFINKNDFFYFINEKNIQDNHYMMGSTLAKQLTNENGTVLIKKNSHLSNIDRMVKEFNFLSAHGVTSGLQLNALIEKFDQILESTQDALEQLDKQLIRQRQITKGLLALETGTEHDQELAYNLLEELHTPDKLTYSKSKVLTEQLEIEIDSLKEKFDDKVREALDKTRFVKCISLDIP